MPTGSVSAAGSGSSAKCEDSCREQYVEDGNIDTLGDCLRRCYSYDEKKAEEKIEEIKDKYTCRKGLSFWGKFALKIGLDITTSDLTYPSGDDYYDNISVDMGWLTAAKFALTTDPGYTRLSESKETLMKGTLIDLIASENGVDAVDALRVGFLFPFYERTYFSAGTTIFQMDTTYWPETLLFDTNIGFAYQIQGESFARSPRIFDVYDIEYTLKSYTMIGVQARLAMNLSSPRYSPYSSASCDRAAVSCYPGYDDEIANKAADNLEPAPDGIFEIGIGIFGEQRHTHFAWAYDFHLHYNPLIKKIELSGSMDVELIINQAIFFYLRLNGIGLLEVGTLDEKMDIPDSGRKVVISLGLGFRPFSVF